MTATALMCAAYWLAAVSPLIALTLIGTAGAGDFPYELGKTFALITFPLLAMQAVTTMRLTRFSPHLTMDVSLGFHKYVGGLIVVLIACHVTLMNVGAGPYSVWASTVPGPWFIMLGRAVFLLTLIHVGLSLFARPRMNYGKWRVIHAITAPVIIAAAWIHALKSGADFERGLLTALWILCAGLFFLVYGLRRLGIK